jgi:hypothetical protein
MACRAAPPLRVGAEQAGEQQGEPDRHGDGGDEIAGVTGKLHRDPGRLGLVSRLHLVHSILNLSPVLLFFISYDL